MNRFAQYGCRPVINASGKMTALGGSAVASEVAAAVGEAAMDYVDVSDFMEAAGRAIAGATGAEDGCPTSGASAGMAIAVAAVIAGSDPKLIGRLPDSEGLRNEIVVQKGHSEPFGAFVRQMIALGGGRTIEVGEPDLTEERHIREAVNDRTAALFYVKSHRTAQSGMQSLEVMIAAARERGLPVIVDAAAEEDLRRYIAAGAELVIYSGAKALEGPTSGLICGRADYMRACREQYDGIGRPMKIGKEGIAGLLAALERYADRTDESERQKERMLWLIEELRGIEGLRGSIVQDEAGRAIYRAKLEVDEAALGFDAARLAERLKTGEPAIYTRSHKAGLGVIYVDPRPLLPGQEAAIAARIKEIVQSQQK
ncbi:DgaE family pyridoxal phosphate-dependent ammonia lyase [Saccharibacillus sp. CPCC 101409]|uniref:DgaE family pyridoxal phosphate-dependent ammonia lyase n=1 Tax=Saccharibacillus sp. CPCC 101409 TaxID=3058041 RepID=UPI002671D536|nr:DgaE family pyridoxal phosphate-dependent ammonia lyase [Saccharibacillus sp. CPCC 101409]MDO3409778.1 DgaE family pyridoxal phosphate-dependent ammonia lyase [Saccharibacillus sp. CPCC 101409]